EENGLDDDGSKQIAHLQDRQFQEDLNTAMAMTLAEANATTLSSSSPRALSPPCNNGGTSDAWSRRFGQASHGGAACGTGLEHMPGLFKILNGGASDEDDEDEYS
ncbi:hypothetical protein DFQ26_002904, partial [Actinomortierella ambigua]